MRKVAMMANAAVSRDGTVVKINFDTGMETEKPVYPFAFDCKDVEHAELLRVHIDGVVREVMEIERRGYYNMGYQDGAKKRKKETWFSPCFCSTADARRHVA